MAIIEVTHAICPFVIQPVAILPRFDRTGR
jgi:hypothetical protein